jgi:predicted proteasome-type protease
MTSCVAAAEDEGPVFLSDSRTNAGGDHISNFRKSQKSMADVAMAVGGEIRDGWAEALRTAFHALPDLAVPAAGGGGGT